MLIATRALLGIAGATLAPSTLSLIRNMFLDPRQSTVAVGVWGASFSAGAAIGPLAGGLLLEHFWWGSAFLIAVPVMALLLVLGPSLLPEFRDPNASRLDLTSAAMSLTSVLALIYGLKQVAEGGMGTTAGLSIIAGVIFGAMFLRRQRTLPDPLIDLRLFRAPAFSASLLTIALALFAAFGAFLFMAQYLQLVLGLTPMEAGLVDAALVLRAHRGVGAGSSIGALGSPIRSDRWGPGARGRWLRDAYAGRRDLGARTCRVRVGGLRPGCCSGHPDDRFGYQHGPAPAGRRGIRIGRDELRVWRSTRHSCSRQHRNGGVSR